MKHFVIVDKKFRIWVRVTTPSPLISERVNLSAKREITDHYDINNKLKIKGFNFVCCFRWL